MSVSDSLKGRWKSNSARLDNSAIGLTARKYFHQVLHARDTLEQRRAEIAANRSLSAIGQADELKKVAAIEARTIAIAQRAAAAGRAKVMEQRMALTPVSDKTNAAAAALRAEIRAALKNMARGEIAALCNDPATDTTVLEALFEGPLLLTGIDATTRAQLLEIVVQRRAGPVVQALQDQSEALDLLDAANRVAAETLQGAAGVPAHQFDKWLAEAAPAKPNEIAAELDKFNASIAEQSAKALPFAARVSLVQSLLETNTAELTKGASS